MPWLETDPMTERKRFSLEAEGGLFSFAELCRRHGISRKTGYKWLERYELDGPDGLADRSHRPHSCPHATDPQVLEAAFKLRKRRPTPRKIACSIESEFHTQDLVLWSEVSNERDAAYLPDLVAAHSDGLSLTLFRKPSTDSRGQPAVALPQ